MRLLAHPDPHVLESALLERVARVKRDDPLARVLIVVPTERLAGHVQRRIAERLGTCLEVHVLHYLPLLFRILEATGRTPRLVSKRLQGEVLAETLHGLKDHPWRDYLERRPGALAAFLATVRDLRQASIEPAAAARVLRREGREGWIARLYAAYSDALRALERLGFADEAGLAAAALPVAPAYADGFRAIFHHGAYEVIGVHLDVLRALDGARPVTVLLPVEPGAPASAYAETFARDHLLAEGEALERLPDAPGGLLGPRLGCLYDESRSLDPVPPGGLACRNAQGADAEAEAAVRSALSSASRGAPSEKIGILVRTLAPYAASLEAALERAGLPWSGSVRAPLRRRPPVHDLLVALRAAAEDFPRAATVELLSSGRVRWSALGEAPPAGDRAEVWSRRARLLRGLEGWKRDLPAIAGLVHVPDEATDEERLEQERRGRERAEKAEAVGRILERIHDRLRPSEPRTWAAHADVLEAFVRDVLPAKGRDDADPAVREVYDLLDEMRDLGALLGDERRVPFRRALDWLERAVDESEVLARDSDEGGFRVLDVMQARGLTFRRVLILGMNQDFFPRRPAEDPLLRDGARERLAAATGRPLPVASRADREERLLLSLALGSAREGVEISWQRADDAGRTRTPSFALREVARLALGRPDAEALEKAAVRVPSHPAQWVEALAREPGLVPPEEARLLLALRARDADEVLAALGPAAGSLAPGLEMLSATQRFAPGRPDYDGKIGKGVAARDHHSVTSLESLGNCPLQYLFRHVLRVRELDEEARIDEIAPRELGLEIHDLLEGIYRTLHSEGLFESPDLTALRARARDLVPEAWERTMREIRRRIGSHLPLLWARIEDRWKEALGAFLDEDLRTLAECGRVPVELEASAQQALDFGDGVRATVRGRFDRVADGPGGRAVSDYKSSGNLRRRGDITSMLKGRTLQVPLYWMLADRALVELLGVGPDHLAPEVEAVERRVPFAGFENDRQREGFLETMRVLLGLIDAGRFPMNPDRHCEWCAYGQACRRTHPPTLHRESHDTTTKDFRGLARKNKTRRPTLASRAT